MNKDTELRTILIGSIIAGLASALLANNVMNFFGHRKLFEEVILAKVFFTSANIVLLSALSINYYRIYSEMSTKMARSLTVFSLALLMYALTSSPLLQALFGIRGGPGLGVFAYIPDLFVSIASGIILYESYQ